MSENDLTPPASESPETIPAAPALPQEPAPMLDVHPAHHAAQTWRDFFIHIATIVLGLIIAVSLEQTVEAIHHHHQRAELTDRCAPKRIIMCPSSVNQLQGWKLNPDTSSRWRMRSKPEW
jgi:hypothetical protein